MKYYLGVDLGLSGGLTIVDEDGKIVICEPMPVQEVLVNKKVKNQYDIEAIFDILKNYDITCAIQERLRAIPNQSSQTGFSLGYGTALFRTIFTVLRIAYEETEPNQWQKIMFKGIPYDSKTTKIASVMAANKLFPGYDFRPSARCKKASDGMTDSALMAVYLSTSKK